MFHRLTAIWLLLIGATLLSVEIFTGLFAGRGSDIATIAVVIVAFLKVRFVGLDFIELRHAPIAARLAFEAWVAILCLAILAVVLLRISV